MIVNLLDDNPHGASGQLTAIDPITIYNGVSGTYGRSHQRWLRFAGGEAQCAFEGAVTALLRPGMRMIDVACGTGTVARRLLRNAGGRIDLTLLDASPAMLRTCHDIPATRVNARMQCLPFCNDSFDLLTCAWGIETLHDPRPALAEFVRATRPGGHVCLVFCADRPAQSFVGQALRRHIALSGRGRFLDHDTIGKLCTLAGAAKVQILHSTGPAAAMILHV